jgi:predicted amidohydrolase YtcJ
MRSPAPVDAAALRGLHGAWGLTGVQVWTGRGRIQEAIGFDSTGRVAACGGGSEVAAALPPGSPLVGGGGAFVAPGFVDPHVHVRASASARRATKVSDVRNILPAVRVTRPQGGWITIVGPCLRRTALRRHDLDRAGRGRPVRVRDRSGHAWVLSSAALGRAGISAAGPDAPPGVQIERDATGRPTGFVADDIGWLGGRWAPVSDTRAMAAAVAALSRELSGLGVVAVCDATATNGAAQIESLNGWRERGVLRQEVTFLAQPGCRVDDPRHAGVKFSLASDERLREALSAVTGWVAVHCVDPSEIGAVLQAAASVRAERRAALRIEHASFVAPDWVSETKSAGAAIVTHPALIDERGDGYLEDPLLEPHDWLYRLASWTRAGVPLAFASDAPFGPVGPLRALRAAASRRTSSGAVIGPHEALAGDAALHAVTTVAARVAGLDRVGYGRLSRGGPGAAVILSDDPRDPGRLRDVELLGTVIGGAVVD